MLPNPNNQLKIIRLSQCNLTDEQKLSVVSFCEERLRTEARIFKTNQEKKDGIAASILSGLYLETIDIYIINMNGNFFDEHASFAITMGADNTTPVNNRSTRLEYLFVPKNLRGKGIGSQLISAVLDDNKDTPVGLACDPRQVDYYKDRGFAYFYQTIGFGPARQEVYTTQDRQGTHLEFNRYLAPKHIVKAVSKARKNNTLVQLPS